MLHNLAQLHPRPLTRIQLATLSGFTPTGGTFGTYLSTLRRAEYITEAAGAIQLTPAGLSYLPNIPAPPHTTQELQDLWSESLRQGERRMLSELIKVYPKDVSKFDLGRLAGFEVSGGTFGTYLSTLRRNGLATVNGIRVKASETLFLGEK